MSPKRDGAAKLRSGSVENGLDGKESDKEFHFTSNIFKRDHSLRSIFSKKKSNPVETSDARPPVVIPTQSCEALLSNEDDETILIASSEKKTGSGRKFMNPFNRRGGLRNSESHGKAGNINSDQKTSTGSPLSGNDDVSFTWHGPPLVISKQDGRDSGVFLSPSAGQTDTDKAIRKFSNTSELSNDSSFSPNTTASELAKTSPSSKSHWYITSLEPCKVNTGRGGSPKPNDVVASVVCPSPVAAAEPPPTSSSSPPPPTASHHLHTLASAFLKSIAQDMGFSASLQGTESHSALLGRQDAEARLLDTMRRVLVARAKCDRDYSQALTQLAHAASKMDIPDNVLEDSLLHKAWRVMIDSLEEWSALMRQNADTLVLQAVEKLASLITEKRASRKVYFDNHQRITSEVPRYQETVAKARSCYEQALEQYKNSKAKYEDHYLKGKPGRKLDELKERYQKSCRKLHLTHNDYVLLVYEANDYERDFRTVLLPGLLEYQQTIQEDMVTKWRTLLQEVCQLTDTTRGRFAQLQQNIVTAVENISPSAEYQTFVDTNRSTPPEAVTFEFSRELLGDGVGSLQAGQLAVDSLTVDALKCRLTDLEQRLKEVSNDHREKQNLLNQRESEIASIKQKAMCYDVETVMRLSVCKRASDVLRRELTELRCRESWLQHQQQLIQEPLTSLGCAEEDTPLPQPWETGGSGLQQQQPNGDSHPPHTKGIRTSAIRDILRKPFRGRGSAGGGSGESPTSTPPTPTRDSTEEPPGTVGETLTPASVIAQDQGGSSSVLHHSNGVPELTLDPDRQLEDEPWFHGVLPREEVVRLLVNKGDYLVRESTRNDERQVVLSVCWGTHKHFIVQTTPDGQYRFEGPSFPTIQELIQYQHSCGVPVTNKSGAVLKTPIFREHWELNNDDVQLDEKIGRGNFGDVYKARLITSGQEVAVKTCRVTLPDEQKKKFLQEGRILKQYDHPNIVRFIGICVQKQPIMIVMELVPGGSLLSYVRSNKATLSERQRTSMCRDTAAGMAYLESKNCIHRDLAARNCLVGDKNIVKISDFGMSREEEEYIVSDGMKQIPIKWTAPEALNFGKYTSLCDVWSYGVLCWEIFSGGDVPYQGYSNTKAREMIDSGYRMLAPPNTPKPMHDLMLKCWEYDPEARPHFDQILVEVDAIYATL